MSCTIKGRCYSWVEIIKKAEYNKVLIIKGNKNFYFYIPLREISFKVAENIIIKQTFGICVYFEKDFL